MKRVSVYIAESQYYVLHEISKANRIKVSEIIRRGIDMVVRDSTEKHKTVMDRELFDAACEAFSIWQEAQGYLPQEPSYYLSEQYGDVIEFRNAEGKLGAYRVSKREVLG